MSEIRPIADETLIAQISLSASETQTHKEPKGNHHMTQTAKSDAISLEQEATVLPFAIERLSGAEVTGIDELVQDVTASCGHLMWWTCDTRTCTCAERCDDPTAVRSGSQ